MSKSDTGPVQGAAIRQSSRAFYHFSFLSFLVLRQRNMTSGSEVKCDGGGGSRVDAVRQTNIHKCY